MSRSFFHVGFGFVPYEVQHDVHSHRTELVLEVANVKHNQRVVDVYVARLAKYTGKSTGGVFAESLR
jgi:hypothetical protein